MSNRKLKGILCCGRNVRVHFLTGRIGIGWKNFVLLFLNESQYYIMNIDWPARVSDRMRSVFHRLVFILQMNF